MQPCLCLFEHDSLIRLAVALLTWEECDIFIGPSIIWKLYSSILYHWIFTHWLSFSPLTRSCRLRVCKRGFFVFLFSCSSVLLVCGCTYWLRSYGSLPLLHNVLAHLVWTACLSFDKQNGSTLNLTKRLCESRVWAARHATFDSNWTARCLVSGLGVGRRANIDVFNQGIISIPSAFDKAAAPPATLLIYPQQCQQERLGASACHFTCVPQNYHS